ncbi:MAG TPA: hypothetical protein VF990_13600 [Candidatus Dormibacteraeota bacterium]
MGAADQAIQRQVIEVRGSSQRMVWAVWIIVTILGAIVGALAAWQLRRLAIGGSASIADTFRYVATILDAVVASGAQWYVLKRYHLDVYWWVPATVAARLVTAIVVIPSVIGLFVRPGETDLTLTTAVISGTTALAAAGLVVGAAQAIVLRTSAGNIAWAWVPATIVGGAFAGAATSAISAQLFGLPYVVFISVVTATGALFAAASQAPVLLRILR